MPYQNTLFRHGSRYALSRCALSRPVAQSPLSSPVKSPLRSYHHAGPRRPFLSPSLGRNLFTWGIIGANVCVFAAWTLSAPSAGETDPARRRAKALSRQRLVDNFTLSRQNLRDGRYRTLLTSAFSHMDPGHLLFNMLTFFFVSRLAFSVGLGPARMSVLAFGSALASSAGAMLNESSRTVPGPGRQQQKHAHLGASGLVEGLLAATTLMRPRVPVYLMFIPIPIPLWVAAAGFLAWDYYQLVREREHGATPGWTGAYVGYAGHLGGAAFGVAYYLLSLRFRFGGVLAPLRR